MAKEGPIGKELSSRPKNYIHELLFDLKDRIEKLEGKFRKIEKLMDEKNDSIFELQKAWREIDEI